MMTNNTRSMASDIIGVIREGTKKWTKTVKAEERSPASRVYRYTRMTRERGVSVKDAAAQIMAKAYRKVSGPERLPANVRQIMYAARPHIQKVTGKPLNDAYFTQVLLPDFIEENGFDDWDVVYDSRGAFAEPHDGEIFGVGTLEVRDYLAAFHDPQLVDAALSQAEVKLSGPAGNFGAVLFVEKQGFDSLLKAAQIAERFDLAVMSTKGMSVVAARKLADEMCFEHDIPLLLLHDFDKAGFSIAGTLQRDTRRYEFQNKITTIDLGLSLTDVQTMRLESEHQFHRKGNKAALIANLQENGASQAEINFMFADFDRTRSTRRVELNAMTSPQFIAFLKRKLTEASIAKIIPKPDIIEKLYVGLERGRRLQTVFNGIKFDNKAVRVPKDLRRSVAKLLKKKPTLRWDAALAEIITPSSARRSAKNKELKDLQERITRVLRSLSATSTTKT
jgi:hypothetical protein